MSNSQPNYEENIMSDCRCESCQNACGYKPGWFMPGEAEKLAEHFGIAFEEVFKTKLSVDWYEADENFVSDVFLLSPSVVGGPTGEEFDANPHGVCVFFVDGACSIHDVKPFECRSTMHTDSHEEVAKRHVSVAHAWENEEAQDQITILLGREAAAETYNGLSMFDGF